MLPSVIPQLVANDGTWALRQAIADPDRFAYEPKVDGVRGSSCTSRDASWRCATGGARGATGSAAMRSRPGCDASAIDCRTSGRDCSRRGADGWPVRRNDVGAARVEAVPTVPSASSCSTCLCCLGGPTRPAKVKERSWVRARGVALRPTLVVRRRCNQPVAVYHPRSGCLGSGTARVSSCHRPHVRESSPQHVRARPAGLHPILGSGVPRLRRGGPGREPRDRLPAGARGGAPPEVPIRQGARERA